MTMTVYSPIAVFIAFFISSFDASAHSSPSASTAPYKTNFLYIMYDDLRPELSIYGNPHMITPNFERLAKRSVTFDYAFCQIAVCNPSRDSLLTGLRPDTVGTYGFQYSFRPNVVFPALLSDIGYKTASYGKILHWDGPDSSIWNVEQWDGGWYEYQAAEINFMNSSTMPDKVLPEEKFRDYLFTSRAIDMIKKQHNEGNHFMVSVGYKLPHLAVHIPYKYFQWYQNYSSQGIWKRPKRELKFPLSSPIVAHKCCALPVFAHMKQEGAVRSDHFTGIGSIHKGFNQQTYNELMVGYAAAVSFLDAQIGRLLDTIDELNLWDNITIVLTSDHGMHNGEKGIWEKWTLFDESTRVPLLISHPSSPFQNQRYSHPVELIDIFPTVLDLLQVVPSTPCPAISGMGTCRPLQGKSLASVVLGSNSSFLTSSHFSHEKGLSPSQLYTKRLTKQSSHSPAPHHLRRALASSSNHPHPNSHSHQHNKKHQSESTFLMPTLSRKFAVSQMWRCVAKDRIQNKPDAIVAIPPQLQHQQHQQGQQGQQQQGLNSPALRDYQNPWFECNRDEFKSTTQICVMGYSFRTSDYRYNVYYHFDRLNNIPLYNQPPYAEELYDHRGEVLSNFTHLELVNLINRQEMNLIATKMREMATQFLQQEVIFHGPYK